MLHRIPLHREVHISRFRGYIRDKIGAVKVVSTLIRPNKGWDVPTIVVKRVLAADIAQVPMAVDAKSLYRRQTLREHQVFTIEIILPRRRRSHVHPYRILNIYLHSNVGGIVEKLLLENQDQTRKCSVDETSVKVASYVL